MMLSAVRRKSLDCGGWPEIANVFGILVDRDSLAVVLDTLGQEIRFGLRHPFTVCLANALSVVEANRNPAHAEALREADMVLADGVSVALLARTPKIAGADLMLAAARHPELGRMRHVLLGGFGVAYKAAVRQFRELSGYALPGAAPFIPTVRPDAELVEMANEFPCDILWVALGCPKQEIWMHENRSKLHAKVVIGVGAAFDFLAGRVRRAPVWVQRVGLEWAWRIAMEPTRWRRQVRAVVGLLKLLARRRSVP